MLLFYVIDENLNCIRLLKSPKLDLTVASRLLCCSFSELRVLRGSCDSVKEAASALASAWQRVVDFKPNNRRSAIGVFDEDLINTPRTSIQNRCVFKEYG